MSTLPNAKPKKRWSAPGTPVAERFWSKVDKNGPVPIHRPDLGPCWLWIAGKLRAGYGSFNAGAKYGYSMSAHRWAYMEKHGPIMFGMEIDHLCMVKACCNPDHLEAVSHAENLRRIPRSPFCPQGHEFTPENTYWRNGGHRACKTCSINVSKQWRAVNRAGGLVGALESLSNTDLAGRCLAASQDFRLSESPDMIALLVVVAKQLSQHSHPEEEPEEFRNEHIE